MQAGTVVGMHAGKFDRRARIMHVGSLGRVTCRQTCGQLVGWTGMPLARDRDAAGDDDVSGLHPQDVF